MSIPPLTLGAIRKAGPCEDGWRKLLTGLGYTRNKPIASLHVSLGDVATINGASDAYWCIRCLDFGNIAARRAIIKGALLPAIMRAATLYGTEAQVEPLRRWCDGDDTVDLKVETAALGATYAAHSVIYAVWAARAASAVSAANAASNSAAYAVSAAFATVYAAAAEREQQRQDIIAAFPPVAKRKRAKRKNNIGNSTVL